MNETQSCVCYPPEKYPAFLRKGCTSYSQCHVMADLRQCATPEGRKVAMAEYHAEAAKIADRASDKPSVGDVLAKVQRLGVPSSALFAVRANDKPTTCIATAKQWWAGDLKLFPALVMAGGFGVGKTVAAAWCAVEWAREYPWNQLPTGSNESPMVWIDGPRIRELGLFNEASADLLSAASAAQLTIVDDVGREGDRRALEALSDVLMERLDARRATVLSTNVKGNDFVARYGGGLADRLRALAIFATARGPSLRGAP